MVLAAEPACKSVMQNTRRLGSYTRWQHEEAVGPGLLFRSCGLGGLGSGTGLEDRAERVVSYTSPWKGLAHSTQPRPSLLGAQASGKERREGSRQV